MKKERLDKLLSNLGYGSRKEVASWAKSGRLGHRDGRPLRNPSEKVEASEVHFDGEPLDPDHLFILLHKPSGVTCSHRDRPPLVFDLLPPRFSFRKPPLSCVGRLDRDTTGTLLLTDQGQVLHRLTSPKAKKAKVYLVTTESPLETWQVERLSQGGWCLPDDPKPLAETECRQLGERELELVLTEGRYHQVKRMLEAVNNQVATLHRRSFAGLTADHLSPGHWRYLSTEEIAALTD